MGPYSPCSLNSSSLSPSERTPLPLAHTFDHDKKTRHKTPPVNTCLQRGNDCRNQGGKGSTIGQSTKLTKQPLHFLHSTLNATLFNFLDMSDVPPAFFQAVVELVETMRAELTAVQGELATVKGDLEATQGELTTTQEELASA